jgi:glycerate dehydrogenase
MNIVVLDGYTLNPGDLSWEGLAALGDLQVHATSEPEEVVGRAAEAEIVLTNKTVLSRDVLDRLPKLRYIGVLATGYNVVDVDAAKERGIPVTNIPAYSTPSVAQMVFAHLLNLTFGLADHHRAVLDGEWIASGEFSFSKHPLVELAGKTLGVVGYGLIGKNVVALAAAFSMDVLIATRTPPTNLPPWSKVVDLDELFRASDVVSLHCPLTEETRHLVNAERLTLMKPTAYLINTGRGDLVDETALAAALNSGRIAGAGVDVLSAEPNDSGNPLVGARNCYITPHIAWATRESRERLMQLCVANVVSFLDGEPQNVVNP